MHNAAKPLIVAKETNMKKVTQKEKKVDFSGRACWVGVDVHKQSYSVALLSEEGLRKEFTITANPQKLLAKLVALGVVVKGLAQESGPTGYCLAWACQQACIPVVVAAPSRIPRPIAASGKTDCLDSMKLAEFLAKGMLKSIAIPDREESWLKSLERRRQQLVERKREVRQHIKAFLLLHSLEEPAGLSHWSQKSLTLLHELPLPGFLRETLDSYLAEHTFLLGELSRLCKQIEAVIQARGMADVVKCLRSIPGVGETIAHTFVSEIFRPERFERAEEICAYVGLAPVISHSGKGKATARLGQVGQNYLRSILVESAWRLIATDAVYREFYDRIRNKTGLAQKAIVAVTRKLLVLIWRIAIERRPYKPASAYRSHT